MARKIQVEILGDARSVGRAFRTAKGDAVGFASTVEHSMRRVRVAAVGGAIAIGGALVKASRDFSSFEQSMSRIVGLAGGSERGVERLSKAVLKLGPRIGIGPKELGEALYFVASAGIKASDQLAVVEASGKAAASGLGETQTVADAVTSAMNAYGSEVLTAAHATDVLVATVREGKGEAAAFAPVIGNVAALAAKLGVKFEDVGAALASMTRLGVDPETASTQLQAFFSGLLKTAPRAEKTMKAFGLSSAGLRKELKDKGLLAVLRDIKRAYGDNDQALARSFPNIRALRGLLALVGANGKDVIGVFQRMSHSTGALTTAFDAAQKDEAFKWNQAKASVEGAFIRIGGAAAPAVKLLAEGLDTGVSLFNDFVDKISAKRTVQGKLDVVWSGLTSAGGKAQSLLEGAIRKVDWDAVWDKAQGIGDGLTRQLDRADWSRVGRTIGTNVRKAVLRGVETVKMVGEKIRDAIKATDWNSIGRSMGPGLAAAVLSGLAALLDPGFWLRNWDLMLSVAIAVFPLDGLVAKLGLTFGKMGARLAAPFAKMGGRLVERLALGIIDAVPRLAGVLLETLPRLAAKGAQLAGGAMRRVWRVTLGAVADSIAAWLSKHGILRFLLKVSGIDIVINMISRFVSTAKRALGGAADWIAQRFDALWNWLQRAALRAALLVVEPFSHLPGRFGKWARDLKNRFKGELDQMAIDADSTQQRINESLSKIEDRKVTLTIVEQHVVNTPGGPQRPEEGAARATPEPSRPRQTPRTVTSRGGGTLPAPATGTTATPPPRRTTTAGPTELQQLERAISLAKAGGNLAKLERLQQQMVALLKRQYAATTDAKQRNTLFKEITKAEADLVATRKRREREAAADQKKTSSKTRSAVDDIGKAAAAAKTAWQAAREQAKQSFGELFQGPVLSQLGDVVGRLGDTLDPKLILADLKQQNAATHKLLADLSTIRTRGAPDALTQAVRELGPAGASIAASLAKAPDDVFGAIVKAFKERQQTLKAEMVMITARTVSLRTTGHPPPMTIPLSERVRTPAPAVVGGRGTTEPRGHPAPIRRAGGGTVPGSGARDTVPAMLTPGELVLNRKQQRALAGRLGLGGTTPEQLFGHVQHLATGGVADGRRRPYTAQEQLLRMLYMEGELGGGDNWVERMNRWFPKILGKLDSAAAWITFAKPSDIAHAIRDPQWGWKTYMNYRERGAEQMRLVQDAAKAALARGDRKAYDRLIRMQAAMTSAAVSAGPIKSKGAILEAAEAQKAATVVAAVARRSTLRANAVASAIDIQRNSGATLLADLSEDMSAQAKRSQYVVAYAGYDERFPPGKLLPADALLKYRAKHADMLGRDPDLRIGAYQQSPTSALELSISRVLSSKAAARKFGKSQRQWSIWDQKHFEEVPLNNFKGNYDEALEAQAKLLKQGGGLWFPEQAEAARLGANGPAIVKLLSKAGARRKALYQFLTEKQQMAARQAIVQSITKAEVAKGYPANKFNSMLEVGDLSSLASKIGDRPQSLEKAGAIRGLVQRFSSLLGLGEHYAPQAEKWYRTTGLEARAFAKKWSTPDHPMTVKQAVDLLAVTSLKARPFDNYNNAEKAIVAFRARKPIKVSTGKVNQDAFEVLSGRDPWGSDALKRPAYRDNILKYADPKAYAAMNKGSRLTVDRHVAAAAFGKDVPSTVEYEWMRHFFDILERRTGKSVENLQAIMWVPQKAMNLYASRLLRFGPNSKTVKGKTWLDFVGEALDTYGKAASESQRKPFARGGTVPGVGHSDTVPAMLTPGELVLNRRQQRGLAGALGMRRATPDTLFRTVAGFRSGGIIGRPAGMAMLPPTTTTAAPGTTYEQHNTITVPPQFADTQWAIERGLAKASWRLKNGV